VKAAVPMVEGEVVRADEQLMDAGFQRAHWTEGDDPKILYVLRLGLWAVRVWMRETGCQLDLGTLEQDQYNYRPWSVPIDPTPLAVTAEALAFVRVIQHLDTQGNCGVE
jgi:hypothetical protein